MEKAFKSALVAILIVNLLSSCGSKNSDNPQPNSGTNQTSEEYLSCKIDGQSAQFTGLANASSVTYRGIYYLTASAFGPKALRVSFSDKTQSVAFEFSGFQQKPGTFEITMASGAANAYYTANGKEWAMLVKGTITITSATTDSVEGTFEFTVDPGSGAAREYWGTGRKVITEGKFRSKYRII